MPSADVTQSTNALALIKADIAANKFYPQEANQYGYSSEKFAQAVAAMPAMFNSTVGSGKAATQNVATTMTPDDYKRQVLQVYSPMGHDAKEVNSLFQTTQSMINQSDTYKDLLATLSANGIIPEAESNILQNYLALFYSGGDAGSFQQKTTVYMHYVNLSNFSTLEKRGMLTVFDILSDDHKLLFDKTYVFSRTFGTNPTKPMKGSNTIMTTNLSDPDMDTMCGGRIIIGLVGGAITGNGIGGLIGVGAALFENYWAGCWV